MRVRFLLQILCLSLTLCGTALAQGSPTAGDHSGAFSQPLSTLSDYDRATVHLGNSLFRKSWRPAPSDTTSSDGLGPLYNAPACVDCHFRDGRGRPPSEARGQAHSLILRLAPTDPRYGSQIQNAAIPGHLPEARITVRYEERSVLLADGTTVWLRRPIYGLDDLGYGPLAAKTQLSPRAAPPVFGLGLLEAISENDILARADPDDRDGDGISGRPNRVWSAKHAKPTLGRFGWKAGQATIADQNAVAFSNDIGIASTLAPALWGDCTSKQVACRAGPHGGSPRHGGMEVSPKVARHLEFYLQGLAAPPARTKAAAKAPAGERVFHQIGCAACHRAHFITAETHPLKALRGRKIAPYSDLLLHDMGDALADHMQEGQANGREWRTAPLWGIGLTQAVSGHTFFLHDGRARNLMEAILWHGGEAKRARDRFVELTEQDRAALLAFLNSL